MKFQNIRTGAILEPNSEMVIEQLQKNPDFQEISEESRVDVPGTETSEKPLTKLNKDELLALAEESGVDVPEGATKAQIVELINAAKGE